MLTSIIIKLGKIKLNSHRYIMNCNTDGKFDIKPNALTYFYSYVDNTWKLIHRMNTNTVPVENIFKFETKIIHEYFFKSNNVSTKNMTVSTSLV